MIFFLSCQKHSESETLYIEKIDVGEEGKSSVFTVMTDSLSPPFAA